MGIAKEDFIKLYPNLFHMAEADTWESIRARGLLSTSGLLDLFEIEQNFRHKIESCHRPKSIDISHPKYGKAVIRDQIPMRESALNDCLTDLTPKEWYEILNKKVFFWPTKERLLRLLKARAYRDKRHCVITVDTKRLVDLYGEKMTLSPINSGSTIYKPVQRGSYTFYTLADYPFEKRRKTRPIGDAIAEIAIDYSVPLIDQTVVRVEHMKGDMILEKLYPR